MLVGTIGINRKEYLYELAYKDIVVITRGYANRHRDMWSCARWQTFQMMASFCGSKSLREAGITAPKDILPLPWDKVERVEVSEEDIAEMRSLLNNWNKN